MYVHMSVPQWVVNKKVNKSVWWKYLFYQLGSIFIFVIKKMIYNKSFFRNNINKKRIYSKTESRG